MLIKNVRSTGQIYCRKWYCWA